MSECDGVYDMYELECDMCEWEWCALTSMWEWCVNQDCYLVYV